MFSDDTIREFERVAQEREDERAQDKKPLSELGGRVRALRKLRSMTQDELADRTGLSKSTIIRTERGNKGLALSSLELIADALGVSPATLISDVPFDQSLNDECMARHADAIATMAFNLKTASIQLGSAATHAAAALIEGDMVRLLPQDAQDATLALIHTTRGDDDVE